jgi:hypothetical protein
LVVQTGGNPQEIEMSVFGSLIGDLRSFASKVEAEFKKMFKEAPSWTMIAEGC